MSDDNSKRQALSQYETIDELVTALDILAGDELDDLETELEDLTEAVEEAQDALNDADAEDEDDLTQDLKAAEKDLEDWKEDNWEEYTRMKAMVEEFADEDDVIRRIEENNLDIEVRSDWDTPGSEMKPGEFLILLCTGGPAVRIIGDLDEHSQPISATIEHQDWFTPWTPLRSGVSEDVLLRYCQYIYFGG